jgi:hypothetical protein
MVLISAPEYTKLDPVPIEANIKPAITDLFNALTSIQNVKMPKKM